MALADPRTELDAIERALDDAARRFAQAPGGLWLVGSASLEAARRLAPRVSEPADASKLETLRARAAGLRETGESRASAHEISALTEWIALATQRATHEDAFAEALARAPAPLASRAELEARVQAVSEELDATVREAGPSLSPATEALITALRANEPGAEADAPLDEQALAHGREALRTFAGAAGAIPQSAAVTWQLTPLPSSSMLFGVLVLALVCSVGLLGAAIVSAQPIVAIGSAMSASAALVLAFWALSRRRAEIALRTRALEAWRVRVRALRRGDEARAQLASWSEVGRVLGQLDAFRRSETGVALEARDHRLPALAPWVRRMAGGFDEDVARRFE